MFFFALTDKRSYISLFMLKSVNLNLQIVDLATLTGACVIALGTSMAGI